MAATEAVTVPTGQEVECVTMTELMAEHDITHIDLLKMDIEGSEKAVLEASAEWMPKVETLIIELHERICPGCTEAFEEATKEFVRFERHGEKITAYRS